MRAIEGDGVGAGATADPAPAGGAARPNASLAGRRDADRKRAMQRGEDGRTPDLPWHWAAGAAFGIAALCAIAPLLATVIGPLVGMALAVVAAGESAQQ